MSDLNSWEDDPAAQEENLSRQAQQMNLNNTPQQSGTFRPGASSFTPGAQSFQPSQNFQQYGGYDQGQYQNYYNAQAAQGYGGYPQYGQQGGYNQYPQGGYNQGYNQGGYNQGYGGFS
jgi:peptide chain release factor subunit 3